MTSDQQSVSSQGIPEYDQEEGIDLIALAKTLWNGRKIIYISVAVGTILGLVFALTAPKEYTVTTIMVPQLGGDMSKSQLSGLASLAGINLGTNQSADLSPLVYPKIVNSVPFSLELMNTKFSFEEYEKPISLYDYFTRKRAPSVMSVLMKYTIGLPGTILSAIKGKPKERLISKESKGSLVQLSKKQSGVKMFVNKNVTLGFDKKEGFLTLIVNMPEALVAAQVAQKAQDLLQKFIVDFKVKKSQADLDFIQERYNVAKAEAEKYQVNVAANADRFKNLTSSLPQVGTARIQTKYTIASSVFQELAKQLEQAKIQVKKDTPVFTIVEPVVVPTERTKPSRVMILAVWIFMSGVIGASIIYGKIAIKDFKQKWNE